MVYAQVRVFSFSVIRRICLILLGGIFIGACAREPGQSPFPGPVLSPEISTALASFNRGAGLLEQYQYAQAAEAFARSLEHASHWTAARFNLGLALLNMQEQAEAEGNLDQAKQAFEAVLQTDPQHLHAQFSLGLYFQHVGDNEGALSCYEMVHKDDPHDPFVAYKYAEILLNLERKEEGIRILEQVVDLDPGFVSALYRLGIQYQRSGRRDEAKPLFDRFRNLKKEELAGGSFTVLNTYGTVGKYYMALGADNLPLQEAHTRSQRRILFSPEIKHFGGTCSAWTADQSHVTLPGLATGDVDGDGDLDLCITALGPDGSTSVWLNDAETFIQHQVLGQHGICPSLGDVDNDGDLDLWLGRAGTDMFFANDGAGELTAQNPAVVANKAGLTYHARLVDVDSDGDLDLAALRALPGRIPIDASSSAQAASLFNNNRDGTFKDIAAELGLLLDKDPVAGLVYDDFDNDRDLDIVVIQANGKAFAWINDRAWQHHVRDQADLGLNGLGAVLSATSGDPDSDGDRDLLICTASGPLLFVNQGQFRFQSDEAFRGQHQGLGASGAQFADMDNDGDLDLVLADALRSSGQRGPTILVNDLSTRSFTDVLKQDPGNLLAAVSFPGYASCIAADFTGNGLCDLLLAACGQSPLLIENVTPGGHWLALDLGGIRGADQKSRSNNSAIGARIDLKTGTVSQQFVVGSSSGPVAQAPLRIHLGLGSHTTVDWLRITWPDAVLQAELELATDQVLRISEIPRKVSSCPHLFAWNGQGYELVSDFGGMGGMGYLAEPGLYPKPDPTEYVPIPELKAQQNHYVLQVVEPIEEVVYFDEAKLLAVDHPQGTTVYPNEMMAVNGAPPAFELFCFENPIEALQATDHEGTDVTAALSAIDRIYAGPTQVDHRFTGYAEDHWIDLDFGERLSSLAPDSRVVLFAQGWVHYSYSATNFAAAQAGTRLRAPSIHVWRQGQWVELFHEIGYPAGLRHMMTLDLSDKLLPTDQRLRITSNMELHWDRIFLALLADNTLSVQEIAVSQADLHFLGYPKEFSPDGRQPKLYDYESVDRMIPWKSMAGQYTRYGEVTELLDRADDCYVIMGPGEEITLRFAVNAFATVPSGYQRSFILKTDSYCKDMDLYTAHPDTVTPLPFHGMTQYPYDDSESYPQDLEHRSYQEKYNTRTILGEGSSQ
jgi:tetratricopeptide (TPR) repeat protein